MALLKINMLSWSAVHFWVPHILSFLHGREMLGGLQRRVWEFEVWFPFLFSTRSLGLKDHLVFYFVYFLQEETCAPLPSQGKSWTITEECSRHPQCSLISEVNLRRLLVYLRLLQSSPRKLWKFLLVQTQRGVEFCGCEREDILCHMERAKGSQLSLVLTIIRTQTSF